MDSFTDCYEILHIAPVFMYLVPKEQQEKQKFLADKWDHRNPLERCHLRIMREGDALAIYFLTMKSAAKPGQKLFALSKFNLNETDHKVSHFVRPVCDSTRYFAVRVTDGKGCLETIVGLAFRKNDAADTFNNVVLDYSNDIRQRCLDLAQNRRLLANGSDQFIDECSPPTTSQMISAKKTRRRDESDDKRVVADCWLTTTTGLSLF